MLFGEFSGTFKADKEHKEHEEHEKQETEKKEIRIRYNREKEYKDTNEKKVLYLNDQRITTREHANLVVAVIVNVDVVVVVVVVVAVVGSGDGSSLEDGRIVVDVYQRQRVVLVVDREGMG